MAEILSRPVGESQAVFSLPLEAHLEGPGGGSGGSWGALLGVRSRLGPFLAALEPIFVVLARPSASLGRSWLDLGRS